MIMQMKKLKLTYFVDKSVEVLFW